MNLNVNLKSNHGFTLIEVVIALMILAGLSIMISMNLKNATQVKKRVQHDIDSFAQVRDALNIMQRDIALAFNYRNLSKEVEDEIKKDQAKAQTGQPYGGGVIDNGPSGSSREDQDAFSEFVGDEKSLRFTTMSHVRSSETATESNIEEVTYFVKECKSLLHPENSSKCLWRRSNPHIDVKNRESGRAIVLMEDVKDFQLKYIDKDQEEAAKKWDTTSKGDAKFRRKFPLAVEITLSIIKNKQEMSLTTTAPIRFTNNKLENKENGKQTEVR